MAGPRHGVETRAEVVKHGQLQHISAACPHTAACDQNAALLIASEGNRRPPHLQGHQKAAPVATAVAAHARGQGLWAPVQSVDRQVVGDTDLAQRALQRRKHQADQSEHEELVFNERHHR